jgi:hypothetical protein
MIPVVHKNRANIPGGLWSDKVGGPFLEGDPGMTAFFVEGRCEMKELHSNLRLFFNEIKLTKRKVIVTEAQKQTFLESYRELMAKQKALTNDDDDDEELSEEELKRIKEDEEKALETFIKSETEKDPFIPRLTLWITRKRPKTRMADSKF